MFAKPMMGGVGVGVRLINSEEKMKEILTSSRGYVFQENLLNHSIIYSIYPGCLNTIRIDTLISRNKCYINAAVLKIGLYPKIADNWALGSLAVGVDILTGKLMRFGINKAKYGRKKFIQHPNSQISFDELQLPYWDELIDVCKRAAFALRPLKSVGWDVAVTEEGPVIIEGNETGDFFLLQEACGPLKNTQLAKEALRTK